MRRIGETLGIKIEREKLKSSMEEVNIGMKEIKVINYEDALNIALKALEKLY